MRPNTPPIMTAITVKKFIAMSSGVRNLSMNSAARPAMVFPTREITFFTSFRITIAAITPIIMLMTSGGIAIFT